MKRLSLLALTAGLLSPIAAKADLGEANLSTDEVAKRTSPSAVTGASGATSM